MKRKILYLLPLIVLLIACTSPAQNTTNSSNKTDKTVKTKTNSSSKQKNASQTKKQKKNEDLYADILANYPNQYYSQSHAFCDMNHDGIDELIIGKADFAEALYYLVNEQPTLLASSIVASAGGNRQGFTIFEDGKVLSSQWSSLSPMAESKVYQIPDNGGQAKIVASDEQYNIHDNDLCQVGITNTQTLNLAALTWLPAKTQASQSENPSAENPSPTNPSTEDYQTDVFPSAWQSDTKLRDGFYISFIENTEAADTHISQMTNMKETDVVVVPNGQAHAFLDWIRQTAPDGTTKNGLESNYKYWLENVKK